MLDESVVPFDRADLGDVVDDIACTFFDSFVEPVVFLVEAVAW